MASNSSSDRRVDSPDRLRFGRAVQAESGACSVQWELRRNCSLTPKQMLGFYLGLSSVSLGIASVFWWLGARLVMPFAWLEVLAVGAALLVHARHVTDRESIRLQGGVLTVERACGPRTERCEFCTEWVRVAPARGDGSLIELSERGRRMVVGRFVRPELRRQLADEMRWALLRRGAVQGPVPGTA
jgi:uncharacterized membrane protein